MIKIAKRPKMINMIKMTNMIKNDQFEQKLPKMINATKNDQDDQMIKLSILMTYRKGKGESRRNWSTWRL